MSRLLGFWLIIAVGGILQGFAWILWGPPSLLNQTLEGFTAAGTLVGKIGGPGTSGTWAAPLWSGSFNTEVVTAHDNGTPADPDDDYYEVTQIYTLHADDLPLPSNDTTINFVLTSNDPDGLTGPVPAATDNVNITVQRGPHTLAIGGGGKFNMCISAAAGQFYSVPYTLNNLYHWTVDGGLLLFSLKLNVESVCATISYLSQSLGISFCSQALSCFTKSFSSSMLRPPISFYIL